MGVEEGGDVADQPKDMRTYLDALEQAGELLHIRKEVDPRANLGGLAYAAQNRMQRATMFEDLKGYAGWRAVSYICGSRRRLAIALGCNPETFIPQWSKMLEGGLTPCRAVSDGPVREVIWKGDQVDLNRIPIHRMADADSAPYIGSGMGIVKDPDTGIRNISLHRHQLKDRNKMGIYMFAGRHMDMIYQKYRQRGEPMPIAITIGHHGAYYLAANWTTGFGVDELEIAGTLLGEPVDLVKCETVDMEAPAYAEMVIEGLVDPEYREMEGPFTEHTGYARAGTGMNPVVTVTAITMRHDAIYYALQGGRPVSESQVLDGMPMEVGLYNRLRDVGGYVDLKDVVVPPYAAGAHVVIIQLAPTIEGQVNDVLMAALSSQWIHPKIAIAVDEDVNPHDPTEIMWSLSTRVNPVRDVFVIPNTRGHSLDASMPLLTKLDEYPVIRIGSRMGIDATKPTKRTPQERSWLRRSIPMGLEENKLEDFI